MHLTSGAHRGAPPQGVPLSLEAINGPMGAYARYGMAKLANLAFSFELSRRDRNEIVSIAVHPGGPSNIPRAAASLCLAHPRTRAWHQPAH